MVMSSYGNSSALLAPCEGNHRSQLDSRKKPVARSCDASLIYAWTNDWPNNRDAGDLRRHRAHHDVTIMPWTDMLLPFIWSSTSIGGLHIVYLTTNRTTVLSIHFYCAILQNHLSSAMLVSNICLAMYMPVIDDELVMGVPSKNAMERSSHHKRNKRVAAIHTIISFEHS